MSAMGQSKPLTEEQRAQMAKNKAEAEKRAEARRAREAAQANPVLATLPKSLQNKESTTVPCTSTDSRHVLSSNVNILPTPPRTNNAVSKIAPVFKPPTPARLPKSNVTVTLQVFTAEYFKILMQPFHSSVLNAIKSVPSRQYDEKSKSWSIRYAERTKFETVLQNLNDVSVTIVPIPENVVRLLSGGKKESVPSDLSLVIDPTLISKLFAYQKSGVTFAIERAGRVLIADEMGLGKSLQAITVARYYKSEWPLLIVCPSSVKSAWKDQFNTFLPVVHRLTVIEKGSDPLPEARTSNTVVIMSYDQMVIKQNELKKKRYSVIILDESHSLKDSKAKRTQAATSLAKLATRVICLSGTPALSRPVELFSQIKIVNDRLFPNYQNFAMRYCDGKQGRFGLEAKGCTNSEELSAILSKQIMIRRRKAEVLTDLPPKRREVVYISGDTIDERMDGLQKAKAAFDQNAASQNAHESLLEYFYMTAIVKAATVSSHILDNYFYPDAPPRKILIFAHHQIVLDTLQAEVCKRKLKFIRIDGSTASHKRGDLCQSFQEDPEVMVAILSITSAGVGITLTAASVVVFAELHWNPGVLLQAEDRAHRVGQKDCVFVQYLLTKNTADEPMWRMVQGKLDVLGQVNLSHETFRDADKAHMDMSSKSKPDISDYFMEPAAKRVK